MVLGVYFSLQTFKSYYPFKFANTLIYCVNTWPSLCTGFLYALIVPLHYELVICPFNLFTMKLSAYHLWSFYLLTVLFVFRIGK